MATSTSPEATANQLQGRLGFHLHCCQFLATGSHRKEAELIVAATAGMAERRNVSGSLRKSLFYSHTSPNPSGDTVTP